MSDEKTMPGWPDTPAYGETEFAKGITANGISFPESQKLLVLMYYERARADAWEARCRVAVEALQDIARGNEHVFSAGEAREALSTIDDLPLPPQSGEVGR